MQKNWFKTPSSQPGRGLDIVRVATALLLLVHSAFRLIDGDTNGFGEYLGSIFPLGVPLAWLITVGTLACSIALLIPRLVVPACIGHAIVLITGIVMIHAKAGWFVVGGGRNGAEYSVLLLSCLFAVAWSYWPRSIPVVLTVLLTSFAATAQPAQAAQPGQTAQLGQTTWTIEKEISYIGFGVSHFGIAQRLGHFTQYEASMTSRSDDFDGASVVFSAKTASVSTDNEQRDKHLRSDDFFNSAKYPDMTFTGTLHKEGPAYTLQGDLTIRDITRPVSFTVQYTGLAKSDSFHFVKTGFVITGKLNRRDFGLKWYETFEGGGPIVGDTVDIDVIAEFNKK
jgi:polyisoprenoid-binding protein YceI/uncharacterized membrane protein YphA (DoxX/SURF4 family)